jgi:uncharacterized protein (TIGR04255 family)
MVSPPYKKPPITEAVIEIRVEGEFPRDLLDKLQKRFLDRYPFCLETQLVNVEMGEAEPTVRQQFQGYRMTAKDGVGVVVITPAVLLTSRLAPYEGWDSLVTMAQENWDIWKRTVGYRKIARVGVRFINRIDVPHDGTEVIFLENLLNFRPLLPTIPLGPMQNFAVNASMPLGKDDCVLILNGGSMPSPLVKASSFVLDIDISRQMNLPQNDEDLWTLIHRIRGYKNFVFEACITDKTRELFS